MSLWVKIKNAYEAWLERMNKENDQSSSFSCSSGCGCSSTKKGDES